MKSWKSWTTFCFVADPLPKAKGNLLESNRVVNQRKNPLQGGTEPAGSPDSGRAQL